MKIEKKTVTPFDLPLLLNGHRLIDAKEFDQHFKPIGYVEVTRLSPEKEGENLGERVVMAPPDAKDQKLPNALPISKEVRNLAEVKAQELKLVRDQLESASLEQVAQELALRGNRGPEVGQAAQPQDEQPQDEQAKKELAIRICREYESLQLSLRSRFADAVITINLLTQSALRREDAESMGMVAELAVLAGQSLSHLESIRPQAFAPIARNHIQWPLMRSTHTRNSDSDELLRDIALGSGYPITLDMGAKWKPDAAADIAMMMLINLDTLRSERPNDLIEGKLVRNCLPPLTRATAGKWWVVGWRFLLAVYPNPCKVKELNQLITATTKQRFESSRKQAIQDKIKARFMAIAKR